MLDFIYIFHSDTYSTIISTIGCFAALMPLLLQSYALSRFIVDMFAENHLAAID
jgi:hypothetical protein